MSRCAFPKFQVVIVAHLLFVTALTVKVPCFICLAWGALLYDALGGTLFFHLCCWGWQLLSQASAVGRPWAKISFLLVLMATVESGISAPTAAAVGQHLACSNVPLNDTMIMCSARSLGGCGAS